MTARQILVIEDEYLVSLEIESILRAAGFEEVVAAATESAALEYVHLRSWDAVVADANLNGNRIATISAALIDSGIPFVIVTGYGREHLPEELAAIPIVTKPFEGEALIEAIEKVMPSQ